MLTKIRRNVVAGILTFIPIWITFWVISFLVGVLVALGSPLVSWCVSSLGIHSPTLAEGRSAQWFQGTVSVAIVLAGLYLLGEIATAVAGRRLLAAFDYLMAKIPVVQSIYGAARQLVTSFQTKPGSSQRVVLIEFPSNEMKTIGLVTRIFNDADTGEEIAAVYVPTTPNPDLGLHGVGAGQPAHHDGLDNQRSDDIHHVGWRRGPTQAELFQERSSVSKRKPHRGEDLAKSKYRVSTAFPVADSSHAPTVKISGTRFAV